MATITGGAGDDPLSGTAESDRLLGGDGDDTLFAGGGEDTLHGGAGRDRAVLDRSADTAALAAWMPAAPAQTTRVAGAVLAGIEDFTVLAGSGNDGLVGAAGDDSLSGGAGADSLQGGAGADTLVGGDGADWLLGGLGGDVLAGGAGADRFVLLEAGAAAPGSTLAATDRVVDFTPGAGDRLVLRGQAAGTALDAIASGAFAPPGGGPLLPIGFAGALAPAAAPVAGLALPDPTEGAAWLLHWLPTAAPGDGGGWLVLDVDRDGVLGAADVVARFDLPAGATIAAEDFVPGTFALAGTGGADTLIGAAGDDTALGFGGADRLEGAAGNDALDGGAGDDTLLGGADSDTLEGGAGADSLLGGDGIDLLRGGDGGDRLDGGDGADLLRGDAGNDALLGGSGDDTLVGGAGADTFAGGAGADLFVLREDGRPAASGPAEVDAILDFSRAEGDKLRLSSAWGGLADGSGATAGTIAGPDGAARPLLFVGGLPARESIAQGMALPAPRLPGLDARAAFWVPATEGGAPAGGWLVLDADGDGVLGAADLVARVGSAASPVALDASDFVAGTFFANEGGRSRAGTAGNDTLVGGTIGEIFIGSGGSDRIEGGAGSANGIAYAGLAGPVEVRFTGHGTGATTKADGGADTFAAVHAVSGTAGNDTLDASAAGSGLFATSLEGGRGNDRIVGDGGFGAQATYAAGAPFAVLLDLHAGTAADGWGGTDALVNIRRVAVASDAHDTVLGSAHDDLFLSAGGGNKVFDGRGGFDEYRYAGAGNITVALTPPVFDGLAESAYVLKPDGSTDRLQGIEAVSGGSGADSIVGSAAAERLAGGAGRDTLDGGAGLDTVRYDLLSPGTPLPVRGAVVDLAAGTATDPWGDTDTLRRIENAWGSHGADGILGAGGAGNRTWLRGLAGADTLRAAASGTLITADHAADPGGVRADLAAGAVLDGWGDRDTLLLIAHLRGGAFADSVLGSAAANWLDGAAGNDTLDGAAGADTLLGGAGDDAFFVDNALDSIVELAGEGTDTVFAAAAWTLGANIEALAFIGVADIRGVGNALDNRLSGNAGANALLGGDGDDTLDGANGNDSLSGGNGRDFLMGDAGADTLDGDAGDDRLEGGAGDDRILGGVGDDWLRGDADADSLDGGAGADALAGGDGVDTLDGGTESDTLAGEGGSDLLRGGDGDDTLLGAAGADWLRGDAGADLLDGGAEADTLEGGTEGDTLLGGAGADLLRGGGGGDLLRGGTEADTLDGGDGADTLLGDGGRESMDGGAGADLLDGGADTDTLDGGTDADTLVGGEGADLLRGGAGADLLDGGGEADALEGGAESDTLLGGAGADLLRGDAGADALDGGIDADTLEGGTEADTLLGGDGGDLLHGEAGADLLRGGAGADTLDGAGEPDLLLGEDGADLLLGGDGADTGLGGPDADTLDGGDGADLLLGGAGADLLRGGAGGDTLDGGAGDDTLDGGGGVDRLHGGAGDDLFLIDAEGAFAFEAAGGGNDTVRASVGHRLNPDIEALVLAGAADLDGEGNASANAIAGNAGSNRLSGGAGDDTLDGGPGGADTLHGGEGDDVFHVRGADDVVVEWAGQGRDTVVADIGPAGHHALAPHVEGLVLAGATARGTGNDLANRIEGNGFGNTIQAGAGGDTLLGGGGDDLLHGGAGADLFVFDPGMGSDRIADFEPGADRLLLRGLGVSGFAQFLAAAADGAGGASIDFGGGQRLLLEGVSEARLGAADLLFG
ncbi:hypothetical protein GCM10009416_30630 [Craurococcus roseus]|uniref:Calcium-binding protein n=1 Tax=Craurococcus roseus TaxID=77585 RepID=A0ABP3QFJ6_9PROT